MNFEEYIVRDPKICGGTPTFKGTRVIVRTILACLEEGDSEAELLKSFPSLKREHLQAAIAIAATSALKDFPLRADPFLDDMEDQ